MICLLRPVSQATLYIICFPRNAVVTYVNVDIHSTCLIMTPSCLKSPLLCILYTNLSHLTTNLFLYVLFCVFPVCYDVRLSHLNEDYLLFTYLIMTTGVTKPCFKTQHQTCKTKTKTKTKFFGLRLVLS